MGKKHKKLARQRRLEQSRKPKVPKKGSKAPKKRNLLPLRLQPVAFVRGDDYTPVKYAMAESRDIQGINVDLDLDEIRSESEGQEVELELEAGDPLELDWVQIQSEPEPECNHLLEFPVESPAESESLAESEPLAESDSPSESPSESPAEPSAESPTESPAESPAVAPTELPTEPPAESPISSVSISDFEVEPHQALPSDLSDISSDELQFSDSDSDLPSDFHFSDDPYHSAFGAYEVADEQESNDDASDPTMDADIDYRDMELDDLVKFGLNFDDDYDDEFDEYANSDADDVITGLLAGNSLNDYTRPAKKPRKQQKLPLSKRRRERLEAKEQARAISFGKTPPLWQNYPDQLTVADVLKELQALIYTPNLQELRFPPLDHNANWYVGEIAKLHGLKVKSYTSTKHHCILILKTSRASIPEGRDRAKLGTLMTRRQTFRRVDSLTPRSAPTNIKTKSSRPKEGQIVGHNAEAVSDGFGHKLMQTMGWSAGTGLGVQRDGIQVPLEARIKLTKSGLQERRAKDSG